MSALLEKERQVARPTSPVRSLTLHSAPIIRTLCRETEKERQAEEAARRQRERQQEVRKAREVYGLD